MRRNALRRDLVLANANAAVWAVGDGLVSTTLVIYLALALGAKGIVISCILAAPRLVGVLRLGMPEVLARLPKRKAMCVAFFLGSGAVLLAMAVGAIRSENALAWLVVAWGLHHLLQYCGVVLLWSWLGDLMPTPVRGRLVGSRERWLTAGQMVGLVASFQLSVVWPNLVPGDARWDALACSATLGAVLIMLSVVPLLAMRHLQSRPSARPRATWSAVAHCLVDPAYRRLLAYSCGLAVANGVTATAQNLYPLRVLGIEYKTMVGLRAMMRIGQSALAPAAGRWIDRRGARELMLVSQLVVALGPLFYWIATPEAPWWIAAAWVAWIAYVGINVGLDHLKLSLAPPTNNAPAIAAYHAISDLANGLMVLAFGWVYDSLSADESDALNLYATLFLLGWLARTAVAALVPRLMEDQRHGRRRPQSR